MQSRATQARAMRSPAPFSLAPTRILPRRASRSAFPFVRVAAVILGSILILALSQ